MRKKSFMGWCSGFGIYVVRQEEKLITARQAAKIIGCSVENIYALMRAGDLPRIPTGLKKGYKIPESKCYEFLENRANSDDF